MAKRTIALAVKGMHCGSCAHGIQMVLANQPGVVSAEIDYPKKAGRVEFDPDKITAQSVLDLIKRMGYSAAVV